MPNWCYNSISVHHEDPAMIQKMIDGADKGELFNTFVTMPEALRTTTSPADFEKNHALVEKYGHADWYSWSLTNWGTKWDVSLDNVDTTDEGRTLHATFDSAWSPPTAFYDALVKLGFKVDATYTEEGMGFAGHYNNGEDESVDLEFDENRDRKSVV